MKKIFLVTGSSGFLGQNICSAIEAHDYKVIRSGRDPSLDLVWNIEQKMPRVTEANINIIHAAGLAHQLDKNKISDSDFYNVNVIGTKNLLSGLDPDQVDSFTYISSVSVYGCTSGLKISEKQSPIPDSAYATSKYESELLISDWTRKHDIPVSVLRLPLVVGRAAPGNLGRMVEAVKKGRFINIDNGKAKRSMVLASDVSNWICRDEFFSGVYNLTDGYDPSYKEIANVICEYHDVRKPFNLPAPLMKNVGKFFDLTSNSIKIDLPFSYAVYKQLTSELTFCNAKAISTGWSPNSVLDFSNLWLR